MAGSASKVQGRKRPPPVVLLIGHEQEMEHGGPGPRVRSGGGADFELEGRVPEECEHGQQILCRTLITGHDLGLGCQDPKGPFSLLEYS